MLAANLKCICFLCILLPFFKNFFFILFYSAIADICPSVRMSVGPSVRLSSGWDVTLSAHRVGSSGTFGFSTSESAFRSRVSSKKSL